MPDVRLTGVPWAAGASVGAYPRNAGTQVDSSRLPSTALQASSVVASDLTLSFTVPVGDYFASALLGSGYRHVAFSAPGAKAGSTLPTVTNANGLRRFSIALADALYARCPIVCLGDSMVYGQGADGVNGVGDNTINAVRGWPGQLRTLFSKVYGDPGEGYVQVSDSRVGNGTSAFAGNYRFAGPLRRAARLISGQALTAIVVPAGVTTLTVIQANFAGDVTATSNKNGGGAVALGALTGTEVPVVTDLAVVGGDSVVIAGPASAQTYITGLMFRNAATVGVPVHRVGVSGYVVGDALGGQTAGVLDVVATADQNRAIRKCYDWAGGPGLLICSFGVNDQAGQAAGGAAGGVTAVKYAAWLRQIVTQAVADGWSVLLVAEPPNPNAAAGSSEAEYKAAARQIAESVTYCAYLDIAELWGASASAQAAGLQFAASVHPQRKGYGDIARTVYQVLQRVPSV